MRLILVWGESPEDRAKLAGELGFEPRLPDPESGVLPLDDSPLGREIITRLLPKDFG